MEQLRRILLRPIQDNERTRRYQAAIDQYVDNMKEGWDLERGLYGSKGIELPHETVEGYWELSEEERAAITSPEALKIYQSSSGRGGTARLAVAAFAWHSPLSRHHGEPELVRFYENGLRFFASTIREDGVLAMYGLNGLDWAHGWDIEGIIYGLVFLWDAIDSELRDWSLQKLRLSAQRFLESAKGGTHGNQGCVHVLGLFLYGHLLDLPEALRVSAERWDGLDVKTLDDSGQVVEQYGPCMHYSYTCFVYAWLNCFIRDGDGQEERIDKCLRWFRYRHTESLYPFPGPSSRSYNDRLEGRGVDIIPACEHLAARNPMFQRFADKVWPHLEGHGGAGHGASPLMWAILACPGVLEPTPEQEVEWDAPFEEYYEWINLLGRSPLKYFLVKRRYQTELNVRDFLPFAGIQTWAWGDEPPIIHPTRLAPSTTQAWGLDTARQTVSQNWGLFGAGAMVPDVKFVLAEAPGEPSRAICRHDRLWRLVIFTDVSTVILEWGTQGPRKTFWTLNRIEPAEPEIGAGVVGFQGRVARLYSTVSVPALHELGPGEDTEGVQVLEYDCGESPCVFAFSDDSFRFDNIEQLAEGILTFSDSSGVYRVTIPAEMVTGQGNPGNCSVSVGEQFYRIQVERTPQAPILLS